MTEKIIFTLSPEELTQGILNEVKKELHSLKQSFQPEEPTEYMTRNEVVKLLKTDLTTLWSSTKKGKLQSYGIGARVYYKRSEVESMIKPLKY